MRDMENNILSYQFFVPLKKAFKAVSTKRACPSYSDEDHIFSGVNRVLSDHKSGRAWIQSFQFVWKVMVSVDCFFKALRSKRRCELVQELNDELIDQNASTLLKDNPFADIKELSKYAIYATDGHYLEHSVHEDPVEGKKRATSHIFSINLQTNLMSHIDLCVPEPGKAKKHEITALKALSKKALRMNQPKGTKVIHAYDAAIVDYRFWLELKNAGIYIITVEKENSAFTVMGELEYDRDDPRNAGVLADQYIGTSNGAMLRRIAYRDPVTGKMYKFVTSITDPNIPPGVIAFIYKCRWKIEKVFDQNKNKLGERKSWGKSRETKLQHANFICLAHNLCILFEKRIESENGIVDRKAYAKQEVRKKRDQRRAEESGRKANALVMDHRVVTQRSCQFIRWLRLCIDHPTSWVEAIELLRPHMAKYMA